MIHLGVNSGFLRAQTRERGPPLACASIVKRANARMELLRQVASFGTPVDDLKIIYILFVRSLLEQSATVWHSSLTQENRDDLERVQRSAIKVILQEKYVSYKKGLAQLGLDSLDSRRDDLCLKFAHKCVKNPTLKNMFPVNMKQHQMKTRDEEKFEVKHANTERFKKSSIIYMKKMYANLTYKTLQYKVVISL